MWHSYKRGISSEKKEKIKKIKERKIRELADGIAVLRCIFFFQAKNCRRVTVNDNVVKYFSVLSAASYLLIYALSPAAGT